MDARQAAVQFLESMNDRMTQGDLIISNYQREVEMLKGAQKNILPSYNSKPDAWTEDIISAQIGLLSWALIMEKETIDLIKEELK